MRKFNEICKELDDKEAQKLLEESYNDVVAMRAVLVNKLIENTKKMRENYILFKTFADVIELNGSRKGHMRNIWMFIILRRKNVERKYRHWNRRKNILLLRMKD